MRLAILSRNPKLYSTRRLVEAAEARGHEVELNFLPAREGGLAAGADLGF